MGIVKYCRARNENKKAEYTLKTEISNHPGRYDAYVVLGMFYLADSRHENAINILNTLFTKDPDNVEGLRLRGNIYLELNKFTKAEADFKTAAKLSPSLDTLLPLAQVRLKLKKTKPFYSACIRALFFGSTNPSVVGLMAQAYFANGEPTKAYLMARKAIILGAKGSTIRNLAKIAFESIPPRCSPRKPVAS